MSYFNNIIKSLSMQTQENKELLKPLEKLSMTKAIPIQEIYIFSIKVYTKSIHKSVSLYSEQKAKLIRKELERCETGDLELDITLSHLKLPYSLKHERIIKVPEEIIGLSKSILDQKKGYKILSLFNSLLNLKERITIDLNKIEFIMNKEEQEHEKMRKKYLHKWS
ncbi:hypothetical protein PNEG_01274 [Pneumocystis murina B123]|uniref:ALIX V-shaped domain-containing protein n=1 Tax=Pneumocystis murina (strain B123) TaxID=1069680 RepID=M7PJD1_PNEMU|nr:hypothetical protein PNEG_01274 [Pneumocystis murina B123]EMR10569.1 hypothetical protein PNEG_01274 [Pneumocystis murina B123]